MGGTMTDLDEIVTSHWPLEQCRCAECHRDRLGYAVTLVLWGGGVLWTTLATAWLVWG